jgi:hypothetical protein
MKLLSINYYVIMRERLLRMNFNSLALNTASDCCCCLPIFIKLMWQIIHFLWQIRRQIIRSAALYFVYMTYLVQCEIFSTSCIRQVMEMWFTHNFLLFLLLSHRVVTIIEKFMWNFSMMMMVSEECFSD